MLSLHERQVAEIPLKISSGVAGIPSLIEELRLEEGRPGSTMESQSGVISDALDAVFGNASLVELIESWLLQDVKGPRRRGWEDFRG